MMEVKTGVGTFRVYEGEDGYGQVNIDLLVNREGKEVVLPVVVVENPTDKSVASSSTDVNATTVYVYETMDDDEYTKKIVIPNSVVDEVFEELAE